MSGSDISVQSGEHADLMDSIYRGQRHIYDFTRKYYLFGRDRLIDGLACSPGASVLEIACGTGRNLAQIKRRWPEPQLFGLDISSEMLTSASTRLAESTRLAQADACQFDPRALFGQAVFDRVVLSYSLSMIPDWRSALDQAARCVAPGGSLHIVDFGDLGGLARPLERMLRAWLGKFHVEPRVTLPQQIERIASAQGGFASCKRGPFGYFQHIIMNFEDFTPQQVEIDN